MYSFILQLSWTSDPIWPPLPSQPFYLAIYPGKLGHRFGQLFRYFKQFFDQGKQKLAIEEFSLSDVPTIIEPELIENTAANGCHKVNQYLRFKN